MSAHLISEDDEIDRLAVSDGACDEFGDASARARTLRPPRTLFVHTKRTDGPDRLVANGCRCSASKGLRPETPLEIPGPLPDKSLEESWALSWVPYPPSQIAGLFHGTGG